jgi:hypothetical protein
MVPVSYWTYGTRTERYSTTKRYSKRKRYVVWKKYVRQIP